MLMEVMHVHHSDNKLFPIHSVESAGKWEDALIINYTSQLQDRKALCFKPQAIDSQQRTALSGDSHCNCWELLLFAYSEQLNSFI